MQVMESAIALGCRFLLGAVLIIAGAGKSLSRSGFERSLGEYGVHRAARRPLAFVLPFAEISLGAALVIGWASPAAEVATVGVLTIFTMALVHRWRRDGAFDCGCLGASLPVRHAWLAFPRNAVLLLLAVAIARRTPDWSPTGVLGGLLVALTVLVAAFLLVESMVWLTSGDLSQLRAALNTPGGRRSMRLVQDDPLPGPASTG